MCGGLGATATLCKLAGLDEAATRDALGLAYSHLSGTMQAHIEGSPAVGLQVGLNARAAVTAFELARAGFPGPRDILEGRSATSRCTTPARRAGTKSPATSAAYSRSRA